MPGVHLLYGAGRARLREKPASGSPKPCDCFFSTPSISKTGYEDEAPSAQASIDSIWISEHLSDRQVLLLRR